MILERVRVAVLFGIVICVAGGCSSEPEPKADTGAPKTTYQMVPATTGGGATPGAAPTPPVTTSSPSTQSPPSAGSD